MFNIDIFDLEHCKPSLKNGTYIRLGKLSHVPHPRRKICLFEEKNPICFCSRYKQMPYTDQITFLSYHLIQLPCVKEKTHRGANCRDNGCD